MGSIVKPEYEEWLAGDFGLDPVANREDLTRLAWELDRLLQDYRWRSDMLEGAPTPQQMRTAIRRVAKSASHLAAALDTLDILSRHRLKQENRRDPTEPPFDPREFRKTLALLASYAADCANRLQGVRGTRRKSALREVVLKSGALFDQFNRDQDDETLHRLDFIQEILTWAGDPPPDHERIRQILRGD